MLEYVRIIINQTTLYTHDDAWRLSWPSLPEGSVTTAEDPHVAAAAAAGSAVAFVEPSTGFTWFSNEVKQQMVKNGWWIDGFAASLNSGFGIIDGWWLVDSSSMVNCDGLRVKRWSDKCTNEIGPYIQT